MIEFAVITSSSFLAERRSAIGRESRVSGIGELAGITLTPIPHRSGQTTTTDYEVDCKGCHIPAQNTDWIYTEAYPVLDVN